MIENRYDDASFFKKYSEMNRSRNGLKGAGEWQAFRKILPDFTDKRVLDLCAGMAGIAIMQLRKVRTRSLV